MTATDKLAPYFDAYSEKIKQRRNELGLTVKELSEQSGVPYSNVSRVNAAAQSNPLLFNEAAVAQVLGLSLDRLCGLTTPTGDESSLRKEIHELQLMNAQKEAEIQRLTGEVNTATEKANGYKRLDTVHSNQLAVQAPVAFLQIVINFLLTIFSIAYLIFDSKVQSDGLIKFGNIGALGWIFILVIIISFATLVISLYRIFKSSFKMKK